MFKSQIDTLRKKIRTKTFWVYTALGISLTVPMVYGYQNPEYKVFSIPFALLMLITLPALGAEVISVRFGIIFAKSFKLISNLFNREKVITYTILSEFERQTSIKKFTILNTIYCFGLAFFIMRLLRSENTSDQTLFAVLTIVVLLSLLIGSGFTISFLLIKRIGFMMNNSKDGSRINFGSEMERLLLSIFAPLQILFFLNSIMTETNQIQFFATILVLGLSCIGSSFFSFYAIKRHHQERLTQKLREQLIKLTN